MGDAIIATLRGNLDIRVASVSPAMAREEAVKAAAAYLHALEDTEEVRGTLTPEYLLTKLQAQQSVAGAQQAELAAMIVYNTALTDLDRLTGTVLQVQPVRIALPAVTETTDWSPVPAARPAPGAGPKGVLDTYRQALMGSTAGAKAD